MNKLLLFSFLFTFFACEYDNEEDLFKTTQSQVVIPDTVTYQLDVKPIIQSNCAIPSCHISGGNGNGIFETYDGLKKKVDNGAFKRRVIDRMNMPASGPLPPNEIDILKQWLDEGALNN